MLYRVFLERGGPSRFFPFVDVESASGSEALTAAPAGVAAVALPHVTVTVDGRRLNRHLWPDPLTGFLPSMLTLTPLNWKPGGIKKPCRAQTYVSPLARFRHVLHKH